MDEPLKVSHVNFEELQAALLESPDVAYQFLNRQLATEGNRFKKRFIAERLSGGGITWAAAQASGGATKVDVSGTDLESLALRIRTARWLLSHEIGATITPKSGHEWLYIRTGKVGRGRGAFAQGSTGKELAEIVARVKEVHEPARLGWYALWDAMTPEIIGNLNARLTASMQVAFQRRVQSISAAVGKLVS